jgi:hypothetical protein
MERKEYSLIELAIAFCVGALFILIGSLASGLGQEIPGTGGLTRYQVAEMLVDCDRGKYEGYCVADVNIRPNNEEIQP